MNNMEYRIRQENLEKQILSPRAVCAADSRGRRRAEPEDPIRTCFQRDRDRVLHSRAFRRLKHKTQVFINPEQDHYRTRLTHTLEVAQIARTIARALQLNEDLTEAIALAHDLGHTPFGHAGEQELDRVYREFAPGARFRHYEQSLRVVDVLEQHGDGPGLNLTWETRDGILRHSKGKADLVQTDKELAGTSEGQVVRIADRVAYINHDIDDSIRAGIIHLDDLPRDCIQAFGETGSSRISTMVMDIITFSDSHSGIGISPGMGKLMDRLKDFLFDAVYWNPKVAGKEIETARKAVRDLFRYFMINPEDIPGQESFSDEDTAHLAQSICDYIAGMTDRYALSMHEKLCGK
jgi:dGTPase